MFRYSLHHILGISEVFLKIRLLRLVANSTLIGIIIIVVVVIFGDFNHLNELKIHLLPQTLWRMSRWKIDVWLLWNGRSRFRQFDLD